MVDLNSPSIPETLLVLVEVRDLKDMGCRMFYQKVVGPRYLPVGNLDCRTTATAHSLSVPLSAGTYFTLT
jgi:hypothetical protein